MSLTPAWNVYDVLELLILPLQSLDLVRHLLFQGRYQPTLERDDDLGHSLRFSTDFGLSVRTEDVLACPVAVLGCGAATCFQPHA
jgi:hypothetical protein